ncbi:MAG: ABC transporter substrate-binding protein [Dehalococcoidia bacterium]|nr:ABC transporter substrate-binding protein [Dehalococcoidia bacterium]
MATQQPQPVVLTPKKGGAFTYGSQLRQIDHDPHASASILFDWDLVANGLLDMDNDTQAPKPDLAERWEVSKDGKVYTFYLRKGVKFQNVDPVNGRELTADDVVYSFERIRTNHPRFIRRSLFSDVVAITAPDRYTIQFSLREPLGPFLVYVASNYNKVVAKEVVDKFGDLQPKESTIGTGPYMVKTWRDPLFAEMVRNPDYWDKDRPSLDVARFQVIEDDITRVAALRTGQIDVAPRVPPSAYESVKTSTNIEWDREAFPSAIQMMFRLDRKPWNDVRVRRAVHLAIDRDDVISGAHEGAAVISGPLPPLVVRWAALQPDELRQMPGYRQPKGDDIAEAKRLLAEAGYPHGFEATMPVSDYSPLVNLRPPEVIQNQLQKIGVQLNFRKLEQAAYIGAERRGDFEVIVRSIGSGDIEPDAYLSPVYTKEGSRNPVGLYDPRLEDLLLRGRRSLDREERRRIYRDAQLLIIDQAYRAYIDEPFFYTGKRKSVRNYNGQWTFDNRQIVDVWLDR